MFSLSSLLSFVIIIHCCHWIRDDLWCLHCATRAAARSAERSRFRSRAYASQSQSTAVKAHSRTKTRTPACRPWVCTVKYTQCSGYFTTTVLLTLHGWDCVCVCAFVFFLPFFKYRPCRKRQLKKMPNLLSCASKSLCWQTRITMKCWTTMSSGKRFHLRHWTWTCPTMKCKLRNAAAVFNQNKYNKKEHQASFFCFVEEPFFLKASLLTCRVVTCCRWVLVKVWTPGNVGYKWWWKDRFYRI